MQGENASQCRPLASVFNAADAVLGRKSRQNVECQHALECVDIQLLKQIFAKERAVQDGCFSRRIRFRQPESHPPEIPKHSALRPEICGLCYTFRRNDRRFSPDFLNLILWRIDMLIKKWLLAAASCTVLALSACNGGGQGGNTASEGTAPSSTTASGASGKVLRVGANANFAPFESLDENQNMQGFDIDLMKALAKEAGFTVEFRNIAWENLFSSLENKDVDVLISAITITGDRKQTMDFSDPYYEITQVALMPAGKSAKTVEDLKKMSKVGVVTGNTGDLTAQKIFGATSGNIARFDNVTLLAQEVENGGLDAAISDSAVIAHYLKHNGGKGFSTVKLPDFEVEQYGIAVRKGDSATLEALNKALKTIRENGEYAKIEQKYFAE